MDPKNLFVDVSSAELREIEGGGWFMSAVRWVAKHIGVSGKDMGGNSAVVVSVKGSWSGNP